MMAETLLCSSTSNAVFVSQASSGLPGRRKRMLKPCIVTGGFTKNSDLSKPFMFGTTLMSGSEGSINSSKSNNDQASKEATENIPSWANLESDELPPWERGGGKDNFTNPNFEPPFFVYLIGSAVAAIAAIGSVFEYMNQKAAFGVVNSDSIFYTPLLGFFVLAGVPLSAFLWFKSVEVANKESEEQDKRDGYL